MPLDPPSSIKRDQDSGDTLRGTVASWKPEQLREPPRKLKKLVLLRLLREQLQNAAEDAAAAQRMAQAAIAIGIALEWQQPPRELLKKQRLQRMLLKKQQKLQMLRKMLKKLNLILSSLPPLLWQQVQRRKKLLLKKLEM